LCFKIDWASLIVGRKFTVFALFYFVFEGNFPSTCPQGDYTWRGDLTEGFLHYWFGRLIFGGDYTWRGLYMEGLISGFLRYFIRDVYCCNNDNDCIDFQLSVETMYVFFLSFQGPPHTNSLGNELKDSTSLSSFQSKLCKYFCENY